MVPDSVPEPWSWWEGQTLHFAYVPHGEVDRIYCVLVVQRATG